MTTYKEAGVDIELANQSIDKIKKTVKETFNKNTLSSLGAFGGCYKFPKDDYETPILVSSTDGVGTKLKIAFLAKRHDTIGQCLVNHCVNDILVLGAKPLFFLDYYATDKLQPDTFSAVIKGMSKSCKENSCVLIAGETAEMPGFYGKDEYDLSGTIIGVADECNLMSKREALKGDVLIGLHSTGLHTNGYSLARKILLEKYSISQSIDGLKHNIGDTLLSIHKSYLNTVLPLIENKDLHAISHITGGGIIENTSRVISKNCEINLDWNSWEVPTIFKIIEKEGGVPKADMVRSFNLGIGMILIVDKKSVEYFSEYLQSKKEAFSIIGEIV